MNKKVGLLKRGLSSVAVVAAAVLLAAGCGSSGSDDTVSPETGSSDEAAAPEPDNGGETADADNDAVSSDEDDPADQGSALADPEVDALKIAATPVPDFATIYYAVDAGLFDEHGISVTMVEKGSQVLPAMLGGEYEVTTASTSIIINALREGLDIRIIAPGLRGTEGIELGLYSADDDIAEAKDLEGKTIAIDQAQGVFEMASRVALESAGVDVSTVNFQVLPFGALMGAVVDEQVDAAFLVPPFSTLATSQGAHLVEDGFANETLGGTPLAPVTMSGKFVDENPNTVLVVQSVLADAADALNAMSDDEYYDFLESTFDSIDADLIREMPRYTFAEAVDADAVQRVADTMESLQWIDEPLDVTKYIPES